MNRSFFTPVEDKESYYYWVWSSEQRCGACGEMLVENGDFPPCEDCGSHTAHACLKCGVWWDHVWPEHLHEIEDD